MILISPSAASHLRTMLAERLASESAPNCAPDCAPEGAPLAAQNLSDLKKGLRIVVEKGGCAGMQYEMHFDVSKPGDLISESEGAFVIIDPASAHYLEGAALDYCDDLVGTGFRLHNPNAARSCGCGTSFEPVERSEASKPSETDGPPEKAHSAQEGDFRSGTDGDVRLGREREATSATRV